MNKQNKVYLVWADGEDEQYWNQFDSLEEAVTYEGGSAPVEVYVATPKRIGRFKRKHVLIRVKNRKKRK